MIAAEDAPLIPTPQQIITKKVKYLAAWKRMAGRQLFIYQGLLGSTVVENWMQNDTPPEPRVAKQKARPKKNHRSTAQGRNLTGVGHRLSNSVARNWPMDTRTCSHPMTQMVACGNASAYWWTCHNCGARWNRVPPAHPNELNLEDQLNTFNTPPPDLKALRPQAIVLGDSIEGTVLPFDTKLREDQIELKSEMDRALKLLPIEPNSPWTVVDNGANDVAMGSEAMPIVKARWVTLPKEETAALIAAREEQLRQETGEMATKMDDVTDLPHQKVVMRRKIASAKMSMGYIEDDLI